VASEWVKARTVPSTWTALGAALAILVGVGAAIAALNAGEGSDAPGVESVQPIATSLSGVFMGQVALGLLGALLITAEFGTGSILTSLSAVPQRTRLLMAKAVILVLLVVPTAVLGVQLAALVGLRILDGAGLGQPWASTGTQGALIGATAYLTLIALFGLAAGALLRSTAAAVIVLTFVLFLLPVLIGLLPTAEDVLPWLPSQAGQAAFQQGSVPGYLEPVAGLALLAGYTALLMAVAVWDLRRRDP
jgi:hypothetical protein